MNKIFKHTKISILENNIVRFEYVPNEQFTNEPTLFVKNKKESNEKIIFEEKNGIVSFLLNGFCFIFDKNSPIDSLKVYLNDTLVYKYAGKSNSGELPKPHLTPYIFLLNDSPRVILGGCGYNGESKFVVDKHVRDVYFLICNKDYKLLRKQYMGITGTNDLPRFKTFGLFHSRYFRYSEKDVYKIVDKYKQLKIPLDNFVLDTNWREFRADNVGVGYKVDTKCFPDISRVYRTLHVKNIEVIMNDHPSPLDIHFDVFEENERKYRYENLTHFYNIGLDSWWYDRNWFNHLISPSKRISSEALGNYIYHDITKQFYQSFTLDPEVYTRPVCLTNVSEIRNGQYIKIKDSACHTYPIQWSGDISCDNNSLKREIKNMILCSRNMVGYYSSDIGGHFGNMTRDQFIRWYQYGCFSPILRPHCSDVDKPRHPWSYDKTSLEIIKSFIDMRYRLMNVLYTASYKHYLDGLGICKAMSIYDPNDNKLINNYSSYMLNDQILVSPISGDDVIRITKKNYVGKTKIILYKLEKRKLLKLCEYKTNFVNEKVVFDNYEDCSNLYVEKQFKVKFDNEANFYLDMPFFAKVYCGKKLMLNYNFKKDVFNFIKKVKKSEAINVRVLVKFTDFVDQDVDCIKPYYSNCSKSTKERIYLPAGEWFDVSNGNVYLGNRFVKKSYDIKKMPLFVKAGSLIPLYSKIDNLSLMSLKDVCYDFYPSQNEMVNDYFYEDDGVSTGYKVGVHRINRYNLSYSNNIYVVKLMAPENNLDDLKFRNCLFKMHVRDGEKIESVSINDEFVKYYNHDHHRDIVPFSSSAFACDSKTMSFKFRQDLKKDTIIKIKIR